MIATNSVAPISGSLRAQVQQLRAAALSKQEFEGLDPDVVGSLTDILDQAESILTVFADEEERVQANADLSEAGRPKAMTKAVRAAHDKLRVSEKKAAERRQAYESESAVISAAPKPSSDSLVSAVRELDIQRRLQTAPLHEQMKAYKIASDNGWGSTMRVSRSRRPLRSPRGRWGLSPTSLDPDMMSRLTLPASTTHGADPIRPSP